MEKKDIEHLATLARIELTPEESDTLTHDIAEVLAYVSQVQEIAAVGEERKLGALYNIMREDEPAHEPGEYTEALLAAAPDRQGRYVRVKKILGGE